ncbi:MAG TPA: VWA domain-containing protein [Myxococcales bacterium]|nr:VWA domain-containing protein [Myxococcales bacterium]HIN86914.1 VWA domain-containing protein [Myxococcales bacterium]
MGSSHCGRIERAFPEGGVHLALSGAPCVATNCRGMAELSPAVDSLMVKRFIQRHPLATSYILLTMATALGLGLLSSYLPEIVLLLDARGYEMPQPQWLWLSALIPLLFAVSFHSLTDLPRLQQWLSTALRSLMIMALALALSGISHVTTEAQKVATVMLVDVSDSVPDASLKNAHSRLQELWTQKGPNEVRLVTFAKTPRAVALMSDENGQLPPILRHKEGLLQSDLQQAIRLAYGLLPEGYLKRVLVASDGNETAGNAQVEAASARRLGVEINYLSAPKVDPQPELMVTSLDVPEDIEVNVPFAIAAHIKANHSAQAKCILKVDKLVAASQQVDHKIGEQQVDFPRIRVRDGGDHTFNVNCQPLVKEGEDKAQAVRDRFTTNNVFELLRHVPQKPKILYVEGERMYSRNFHDALKDDFEVEVRGQGGIPNRADELEKYKAVIISDVPKQTAMYRENMTYRQMRLLHDYAKKGGMLLMTGGQDSLGPGGYTGSYLERQVLPVRLEVQHEIEMPRLALVLVIDRSGSMSGKKLELAKKAARETVNVLSRQDKVAILAFDSKPTRIIRLTTATSTRRFDNNLRMLTAGGGTSIFPALDAAFNMLDRVQAQLKHVILLTDGQSNRAGILALVEEASRKKITISSIAIGSGSDRSLLSSIADVGRGRYYFTESADSIPKLFVDETRQVAKEAVVSDRFKAAVNPRFAKLRFLRGIRLANAPTLGGYVSTQAKPGADTILVTNRGEPLLARWKRGKGWVYVFTSDIKNKWGRRWLKWEGFAPFWRQLIKDGIEQDEKVVEFPITVSARRHVLNVAIDSIDRKDQFVSGIRSTATITDPKGKKRIVELSQSASGRSESKLPISLYGPYRVDVRHEQNGKLVAISRGQVSYPYPEEHLRWTPDMTSLASLAQQTHGVQDPTTAALLTAEGEQLTHRAPLWDRLLYVVLFAFVFDVFLRRVRLWKAGAIRWSSRLA